MQFRNEYYFLSNMYPVNVPYRIAGTDYVFPCAESAFQAAKSPAMAGFKKKKTKRKEHAMLTHFDSQQQKNDCIAAIERSLLLWGEILRRDGARKEPVITELKMRKILPGEIDPENGCYLCEYAKQQTAQYVKGHQEKKDEMYDDFAAGFDCTSYCPVIWDKDDPDNLWSKEEPPCQTKGSPYRDYWQAIDRRPPKKPPLRSIRKVQELLKDALRRVQDMPVSEIPSRLTSHGASGQILVHLENGELPFVVGEDHPLYPALSRLMEYEDGKR